MARTLPDPSEPIVGDKDGRIAIRWYDHFEQLVADDLTTIEADIATLQTDVDAVEADVATLQTDLSALDAEVSALNFWRNERLAKTANYTLANDDKGKTIALGGSAYYVLTVNAASGYDANFQCMIVNEDTARGKRLTIDGITSFLLWPGQSVALYASNNTWHVTPHQQRWVNSAFKVYVNSSVGNDNNDGQVTGSGAVATIAAAQAMIGRYVDSNKGPPEIILDGNMTHNVGSGLFFTYEGVTGASQMYLTGGTATVISCDGGGTCLSVQDRGILTVTDVTLDTTGNSSIGAYSRQLAVLDLVRVNFDGFPLGVHIACTTLGAINVLGNYSITGGAATHIQCTNHGYVNYGSYTCTVSGGLTISYFATASDFGIINNGGVNMSFAGAGAGAGTTGTTFAVSAGGVIRHSGTLPGNVAGTPPTDLSAYGIKA